MKNKKFGWLIKWMLLGVVLTMAITVTQLSPAPAKYAEEFTFPSNRFGIVYGDALTMVSDNSRVENLTNNNKRSVTIKFSGYHTFMALGGTGGDGGEGGWISTRARVPGGARGSASGMAQMTAGVVINAMIATGGENGDNDRINTSGTVGGSLWSRAGFANAASGNRGDGCAEGAGGGGATYLAYGADADGNKFAAAGGGGGGGGNRYNNTGGQGSAVAGYGDNWGGKAGNIDGVGNNKGDDGGHATYTNCNGKGGIYNSWGSSTGGGAGGYCTHGSTTYNAGSGGWENGGDARNPSAGGGGGAGYPGGGGATQGCNENFAGKGGGGGASVVRNANGLSISATPASLFTLMETTAVGIRARDPNQAAASASSDRLRNWSGSAVIAFVGYRNPSTYMLN